MAGATRPYKTVDDYLALPDDVRAELIDGELYVTPSPGMPHQRALGELYVRLREHVLECGFGEVFLAPLDVHLPTGDIVQPDLVVVATDTSCELRRVVHGAPELVVEILSPFNPERDLVVKRTRYAKAGVPEYWIVDCEQRGVDVLVLDGGTYRSDGWYAGDAILRSPTLPRLRLPVASIFRNP